MLHMLVATASPRPVWWLHGARNSAEHAFRDEANALLKRLPNVKSHIRYSRPGPDDRSGIDFDAPGRLDMSVLAELGVPLTADFYLCGPRAFMADLTAGLAAKGVPAARIRTEVFGPGSSLTPGIAAVRHPRPHSPLGPAGAGPLVAFARSGVNVKWDSRFASLLELAEACDVPVRWSCRTGVCHSCETAMIAGEVEYQTQPVDPPAAGNVLICCSRPMSDITLDL